MTIHFYLIIKDMCNLQEKEEAFPFSYIFFNKKRIKMLTTVEFNCRFDNNILTQFNNS